jgi:hypothetical protein
MNAIAATIADSPITALSLTTAFMPTKALRWTMHPCRTAPCPMWPSSSTMVSVPGKPCITQQSWRLAPVRTSSRPKSPRNAAHGPM